MIKTIAAFLWLFTLTLECPAVVVGSNFPMYSIGDYTRSPADWFKPGLLHPLIGTYHHNPRMVWEELKQMRSQGQTGLTLMIWFGPLKPDESHEGVYGHVIDSKTGHLMTQHQYNLIQILEFVRQMDFRELVVRFAPQGNADPQSWKTWSDLQFRQNMSFIFSTRALIEKFFTVRNPQSTKRIYDLSAEAAGATGGFNLRYLLRLWQVYRSVTGGKDSYGFSFIASDETGLISKMMSLFDLAGGRPPLLAFDIYRNEARKMALIESELAAAGEKTKPVIIQEVFYNDAVSARAIEISISRGLNVRSLYQWPLKRDAPVPHFSMDYAPECRAYLNL